MRVMPIRIFSGLRGTARLSAAFRKNYVHYLQESLGLGLFMVSACFFGAMLYAPQSPWYHHIPVSVSRDVCMGLAMGATALFIFYAPFTAPSGSQINPAVTLSFLRLDKMCRYDALFYILFQFTGATAAVKLMQWCMGTLLSAEPVNTVVTVPGRHGIAWASITELVISFLTMSMVLFTSASHRYKKYTRVTAACMVCTWVILAGPVSGFSMNPARTFASSIAAGIWTGWWIYLVFPLAGMLLAAEFYLLVQRNSIVTPGDTLTEQEVIKMN
jgi:aquaporin Z